MKIVILAGNSESHRFVYNAINDSFEIAHVIVEEGIGKKRLIKGRLKRLGFFTVMNQLVFQALISPILYKTSKKRISELKSSLKLDDRAIPTEKVTHVSSVNSAQSKSLLQELQPAIVLVVGTRIISTKVLECIEGYFVNTHVGITPQYRGVHGAYWALANDDKEHCGVTIHLVDKGVDTGGILKQAIVEVTKKDNFATYKYIQFEKALLLLQEMLGEFKSSGKLISQEDRKNAKSALYYHPTATGYILKRILKGVK
ncbi:MAG: formyl transferase [Flavobacteriaceae bacterium]|nr:formyl transferase [Flavobacteriaceae bacterium]